MRSRVMPGSLVTMERRVPVKRLNSVDLPTLGRPTITSDGRRSAISSWAGRTLGATASCAIFQCSATRRCAQCAPGPGTYRSEEHTSELQSHLNLVCRLLLEKKKHQERRVNILIAAP